MQRKKFGWLVELTMFLREKEKKEDIIVIK